MDPNAQSLLDEAMGHSDYWKLVSSLEREGKPDSASDK
jgi:hypothetical protein